MINGRDSFASTFCGGNGRCGEQERRKGCRGIALGWPGWKLGNTCNRPIDRKCCVETEKVENQPTKGIGAAHYRLDFPCFSIAFLSFLSLSVYNEREEEITLQLWQENELAPGKPTDHKGFTATN